MKLLRQDINRDQSGTVTLLPEEPEDMWHAYNIIAPNDLLTASAVRKVVQETDLGTTTSKRVHMDLTIKVKDLDFDPKVSTLRVKGPIIAESQYAPMGSFHTLDLELQRKFTLAKADGWDSVAMEMLREATKTSSQAHTYVVIMVPGDAKIFRITEHRTVFEQSVQQNMPGKSSGSSENDKATAKFHQMLLSNILTLQGIDSLSAKVEPKPLLLASPGFAAQNFLAFMKQQATLQSHKPLFSLINRTVVTHASSASSAALAEVLSSKAVRSQMNDARFARESQLLDRFYESLRKDDGKAWYGPKEVEYCVAKGAVTGGGGALLISNKLFRSVDVAERKRWVRCVDKVKAAGGDVRVLSDVHESGKRLEALGGIAALLTYPIYEIEDEEGEVTEALGQLNVESSNT
jgi:protein pelota